MEAECAGQCILMLRFQGRKTPCLVRDSRRRLRWYDLCSIAIRRGQWVCLLLRFDVLTADSPKSHGLKLSFSVMPAIRVNLAQLGLGFPQASIPSIYLRPMILPILCTLQTFFDFQPLNSLSSSNKRSRKKVSEKETSPLSEIQTKRWSLEGPRLRGQVGWRNIEAVNRILAAKKRSLRAVPGKTFTNSSQLRPRWRSVNFGLVKSAATNSSSVGAYTSRFFLTACLQARLNAR